MGRKNKPGNSGFSGHGHSHGALDDRDDHSHGHGHGGFNASSVPVAGSGDIPLALLDRRSSDSPLLGGDADHSVLMQLEPLAVSNARSSAGGLLASHGDDDNSDAEGCRHLAATTTECGHNECLSPEEVKANTARQTLIYVSFFCFAFMVVELVGGYISNSLAIMTDAAHLLSDLASFLISIVSLYVSRKAATSSYSFGFHRAEILGAIVSVLLIWALTGVLLVEAFDRFAHPVPINGVVMFAIATLGLCVNVSMGTLLMYSGHGHSHGLPGSSHGHSHGGDSDDHGHGHSEDDEHDEHDGHDHGHGHNHGGAAELTISTDKSGLLAGAATGGNAAAHRHRSSYGSDSLLASDHSDDDGHGHGHGGGHGHSHDGDGHGDHDDHDDTHGHSHSASTNKKSNLENMSFYDKLFNNPNHNINLRAAMVHVLGDALQSLGVMLAAALIWYNPNWAVADPICTVVFSFIVLFTTMRIMREAVMYVNSTLSQLSQLNNL